MGGWWKFSLRDYTSNGYVETNHSWGSLKGKWEETVRLYVSQVGVDTGRWQSHHRHLVLQKQEENEGKLEQQQTLTDVFLLVNPFAAVDLPAEQEGNLSLAELLSENTPGIYMPISTWVNDSIVAILTGIWFTYDHS